jgi:hypothetical protein
MASVRDVLPRAERLGATVIYHGSPPRWLLDAAKAAQGGPVIVNCKGLPSDQVPCIISLADLERLTGGAK